MNVSSEDSTPKQKKYAGFVSIKNWLEFGFGVKSSRKMHIHHIDQNPSNNDIRNLILVTAREHRYIHSQSRIYWEWKHNLQFRKLLSRIRMFPLIMTRSTIQDNHNGQQICDKCGGLIAKNQRLQKTYNDGYAGKKFHYSCWNTICMRHEETTGEAAELRARMQSVWDRRDARHQARVAAKALA